MVEQSNQNCTGLEDTHSVTRGIRSEFAARKSALDLDSRALEPDSEGQDRRKDSIVPLWAFVVIQHCGSVHMPSLFQGTQWPDRESTLYLPERSLPCVTAFSVSHGEEPHVKKVG